MSVLQRWLATEACTIISACAQLQPAKRDLIVGDWEVAKQHLIYSITSKFSFASHIPFHLCSLAHHDQDTRSGVPQP